MLYFIYNLFHMEESMGLTPQPLLYVAFCRKKSFDFESECFGCTVVFYLERGKYEYTIGELSGVACPGEAVICPPGVRFHRRLIEPVDLHVLHFSLPGQKVVAGKIRLTDPNRIKQDLSMISRRGIKHTFNDTERHFLRDIWYILDAERQKPPRAADPLMDSARSEIASRISERFAMSEIAENAGLTPVALLRRFRRAFGQTPSEYLSELRIGLAERLLCETDLPLAAIAVECGYENEYYFSTCFRKKVGVPPGAYRRSALV